MKRVKKWSEKNRKKMYILADPDSMSTGTTLRPMATDGVCIGFDRAGRFAGQFTPISTASLSMCCNVDLIRTGKTTTTKYCK